MKKIGILSDTHDNLPKIKKVVELFIAENVDLITHCGDYV
ncbi:MAG: metallophosphoesterase family protein, partial [Promethearchaeota archaeon]